MKFAPFINLLTAPFLARRDGVLNERQSTTLSNSTSNTTTLAPQFFTSEGSKRVMITYGPYLAPSSNDNNGMADFLEKAAKMPCTDCLITFMQAGLTYPNGTYANADTGLWLHHVVLSNLGRPSAVCPTSDSGDRFFASGNERTAINICVNGTDKAGYYVNKTDHVVMLTELMNETEDPRPAVVTITYEYIPGMPAGFDTVTPVWLDIGNCSDSDVPAKNNTAFQYSSQTWKSTVAGKITGTGAHLHDGGTHLEVMQNGKDICNAQAIYGGSPGYVESMNGMSGMDMSMGMDMVHVSSIGVCANVGPVDVGDEFSITAYYNTTLHSPMLNSDGSLADIMGISILYIASGNASISTDATTVIGPTPTSTSSGMSSMSGMSGSMTMAMGSSTTSARTKVTGAAAAMQVPMEMGGVFAGMLALLAV
jgi:hypothetical protein